MLLELTLLAAKLLIEPRNVTYITKFTSGKEKLPITEEVKEK